MSPMIRSDRCATCGCVCPVCGRGHREPEPLRLSHTIHCHDQLRREAPIDPR